MTKILKLPGLIDTHVHLREPGATQKEDFETGTKAAIAGGYTMVLDMPNNPSPVVSLTSLDNKINLANDRIYADLGFHFGGTIDAIPFFEQVRDKVFGLKVYMNHTTGPLLVEKGSDLEAIFSAWPSKKVILVHAEGPTLEKAIAIAKKFGNRLHVCHVSQKMELELIQQAKKEGLNVTCEVGMHHLYLTEKDLKRVGPFGKMRPPLAAEDDRLALWEALIDGTIDIIASDHAPHTKEEKGSDPAPNGVPGLETSLPLLLNAVNDGRLTINDVQRLCYDNPKRIFNIPEQEDTYVEVDLDQEWTISNDGLFTKCGWTPFEGFKVRGKVVRTAMRGQTVFEDGKIVNGPRGQVMQPNG